MSEVLRKSASSIGTVSNITGHAVELENLVFRVIGNNPPIEDPSAFAMEKHLEDFLVANWSQTIFAKDFDIYKDDDGFGQQFPTDTGPIDILAVGKDKKTILVIELKKGRASDAVVGQILRYMGYVQEELAEAGQTVKGAVIALEDDRRLRRALAMTPLIEFYRYQISFKLTKA